MIKLNGTVQGILDVILEALKQHFYLNVVIGVIFTGLLEFLSYNEIIITCNLILL